MINQLVTEEMLNSIDPIAEAVRECFPNAEVFSYGDYIVIGDTPYRRPDISTVMPFDKYGPFEIWITDQPIREITIKRIFP